MPKADWLSYFVAFPGNLNLVISRCCFKEDGNEMYQSVRRALLRHRRRCTWYDVYHDLKGFLSAPCLDRIEPQNDGIQRVAQFRLRS